MVINCYFTIHCAEIRPHLEYYSVIWSNLTAVLHKHYKMTKLQRRVCKLIIGHANTHLEELIIVVGYSLLLKVFVYNKTHVMYRMANILRHHFIFNQFVSNEKLFT